MFAAIPLAVWLAAPLLRGRARTRLAQAQLGTAALLGALVPIAALALYHEHRRIRSPRVRSSSSTNSDEVFATQLAYVATESSTRSPVASS